MELSEVSVDSLGLAKVASASESDDSHENDSMSEADKVAACSTPPPVGKKDWRAGAIKRPACSAELAHSETSSKSCKKPAASPGFSHASSKKPATVADDGPIHVETLSIGGGKVHIGSPWQPGGAQRERKVSDEVTSREEGETKKGGRHRENKCKGSQ